MHTGIMVDDCSMVSLKYWPDDVYVWWKDSSPYEGCFYSYDKKDIVFTYNKAMRILAAEGWQLMESAEYIGNRDFIYAKELSEMIINSRHYIG